MTNRMVLPILLMPMLLGISAAWAQTQITQSKPVNTQISISQSTAANWGLDDEEWTRYQSLINTEAGLYYKQLEPSFVLGIYARNEVDRRKYARATYDRERVRIGKLLAFNRAYQDYAEVVDGQTPLLNPQLLAEHKVRQQSIPVKMTVQPPSDNGKVPYVVFVKSQCPACDTAIKKLIQHHKAFEVYLVDAQNQIQIRQWATKLKIPRDRVKNGEITLNHDLGYAQKLGIKTFPTIYIDTLLIQTISVEDAVQKSS